MIAIEGYKTKYKVLSAASGASRPVGTGDTGEFPSRCGLCLHSVIRRDDALILFPDRAESTVTVHATGVYYFKKEAGKTFWWACILAVACVLAVFLCVRLCPRV